ncbi:hypothetical protein AKJ16_DCAP17704 [Drosera capensis]
MLLYMGSMSIESRGQAEGDGGLVSEARSAGSVYRSPEVFENLWSYMEAEGNNQSSIVDTSHGACQCPNIKCPTKYAGASIHCGCRVYIPPCNCILGCSTAPAGCDIHLANRTVVPCPQPAS